MPNGDPRIFGLPCRFPATPSILAAVITQVYDRTRFFGMGEPRKVFSRVFPARQGRGEAVSPVSGVRRRCCCRRRWSRGRWSRAPPHGAERLAPRSRPSPRAQAGGVPGLKTTLIRRAWAAPAKTAAISRRSSSACAPDTARKRRSGPSPPRSSPLPTICSSMAPSTTISGPTTSTAGPKPFRPGTPSLVSTNSVMPSR